MIDPETAVRIMRAEGQDVTLTDAPEFIVDVDGNPLGLDPGKTTTGTLGPLAMTGPEWEATARYLLDLLDGREDA